MVRRDLLLGLVRTEFAILHYRTLSNFPFIDRSGHEYEVVTDPRKRGLQLNRSEVKTIVKKYNMKIAVRNDYGCIWVRPDQDWYGKWHKYYEKD